jgi:D-sedoheptulose 7-phosphate isomerase
VARRLGVESWALVGPGPSPLERAADRCIAVAAPATPYVQEAHQVAIHLLCAAVDERIGEEVA